MMSGILIALISGALMSVQGVFNTAVTKQTSLWAVSYTHLIDPCMARLCIFGSPAL